MDHYESEAEIEAVVQGFESCATPKEDFKHRSHLTVAVWYLSRFSEEEALQRMRSGLFGFLDHHGVGREKYNETLTIFWIKLVQNAFNEIAEPASLVAITNTVLDRLADASVISRYYSEERLQSAKAKHGWLEPDIKQLSG